MLLLVLLLPLFHPGANWSVRASQACIFSSLECMPAEPRNQTKHSLPRPLSGWGNTRQVGVGRSHFIIIVANWLPRRLSIQEEN